MIRAAMTAHGFFSEFYDVTLSTQLALAAVLVGLVGCGSGEVAEERDGLRRPGEAAPLPPRLSELALFPSAPDLSVVPEGVTEYAPRYPLWSNGSEKLRHIALPPGFLVDDLDLDGSEFPVGTLFFKTFSYPDASAPLGARHIETRVLRRLSEGWDYATYAWNEAGTDAERPDERRSHPVRVTAPGGASFDHVIPSVRGCKECHDTGAHTVLGFNALQLGERELPSYFGETTRRVAGILAGNCVHCHDGSGRENAAFDLRPERFLENTIGRPTESSASAVGIRIVPGSPEESILYRGMRRDDPDPELKPMPPVGVDVRDDGAVETLRGWIAALDPTTCAPADVRGCAAEPGGAKEE